ncbi:MAG: acylphosphatase [Spirochaetes bacterium]|nr:acylphosphatase [Spirochaetota bacterium]
MLQGAEPFAAFRARVLGMVQGVGFRYATRSAAHKFGVRGWVRNAADGSVEIECEGPDSAVHAFRSWLDRGPAGARVISVESRPIPFRGIYTDFTVEF